MSSLWTTRSSNTIRERGEQSSNPDTSVGILPSGKNEVGLLLIGRANSSLQLTDNDRKLTLPRSQTEIKSFSRLGTNQDISPRKVGDSSQCFQMQDVKNNNLASSSSKSRLLGRNDDCLPGYIPSVAVNGASSSNTIGNIQTHGGSSTSTINRTQSRKFGHIDAWVFDRECCIEKLKFGQPKERFRAAAFMVVYHLRHVLQQPMIKYKLIYVASRRFRKRKKSISNGNGSMMAPWVTNKKMCAKYLREGSPIERFRAAAWIHLYHSKSKLDQIAVHYKVLYVASTRRMNKMTSIRNGTKESKEKLMIAQLSLLQRKHWKLVRLGLVGKLKKEMQQSRFSPFKRGVYGETFLHVALLFNQIEVAKLLVRKYPLLVNAIYKESTFKGQTPLHIAVIQGNIDMVKFLIAAKASVNGAHATGKFFNRHTGTVHFGDTPLHFAVSTNKLEIVKYLVKCGADLKAVDSFRFTVFHLAVTLELQEMYILLEKAARRKHGRHAADALINLRNEDGLTAFQTAAANGNHRLVNFLIEHSKIIGWQWGPVTCLAYPVNDLVDGAFSIVEIAVRCGNSEILDLPVIKKILLSKWETCSRNVFISLAIIVFLQCMLLTAGFVTADFAIPLNRNNYAACFYLALLLGVVTKITNIIHEFRLRQFRELPTSKLDVNHYFMIIDLASGAFNFIAVISHAFNGPRKFVTMISSIGLLATWAYTIKYLLQRKFLTLVLSSIYIFKKNVIVFIGLFIIITIALSAPVAKFHGSHPYHEWIAELTLTATGFGPTFPDAFEPEIGFEYYTAFILYGFVVVIVGLNLLIAIMSDTYSEISGRKGDLIHIQLLADYTLEMEHLYSLFSPVPKIGKLATEQGIPTRNPDLRVMTMLVKSDKRDKKDKDEQTSIFDRKRKKYADYSKHLTNLEQKMEILQEQVSNLSMLLRQRVNPAVSIPTDDTGEVYKEVKHFSDAAIGLSLGDRKTEKKKDHSEYIGKKLTAGEPAGKDKKLQPQPR